MQNTSLTIAVLQTESKILIDAHVNSGFGHDLRLARASLGRFA